MEATGSPRAAQLTVSTPGRHRVSKCCMYTSLAALYACRGLTKHVLLFSTLGDAMGLYILVSTGLGKHALQAAITTVSSERGIGPPWPRWGQCNVSHDCFVSFAEDLALAFSASCLSCRCLNISRRSSLFNLLAFSINLFCRWASTLIRLVAAFCSF